MTVFMYLLLRGPLLQYEPKMFYGFLPHILAQYHRTRVTLSISIPRLLSCTCLAVTQRSWSFGCRSRDGNNTVHAISDTGQML